MNPLRATASPLARDVLVLATILVGAYALYLGFAGPPVLDIDVVYLALGIHHFDVLRFQPHPPGYLGYELVLRAVHLVTGESILAVTRLTSRLFALLTIAITWRAALRFGAGRQAALWAAALVAANPVLLYYGIDGQTHSAEAATAAALMWVLADPIRLRTDRGALLTGLVLALGGSLRPSFAIVSVLPVLWALWPDLRRLTLVALVGAAGSAAWLVPTVLLSGGWASYHAANQALVGYLFALASPLSPDHVASFARQNLVDTLAWSALALAPALPAIAKREPSARRALWLLGTAAVPAILFYATVFCAEAGYVAGLVVPAALAGVLAGLPEPPRARRTVACAALVAAQLAFFCFGPLHPRGLFMLPDAAEVISRELQPELLRASVARGTSPGDRILVISDSPDLTTVRQLPFLRRHTDVLYVNRRRDGVSLSYGTTEKNLSAPGEALLETHGPRPGIALSVGYDWVVLDARSSPQLWHTLGAQTHCAIAARGSPHLRMSCFSDGVLHIGGYWLRTDER